MYSLVPEKVLRLVYEPFYLAIYDGVVKSPSYCVIEIDFYAFAML